MTGPGGTPYATLADPIEAAEKGKRVTREHGARQKHSIIEAPASEDAVTFAAGVQPPGHVLERIFGDSGSEVVGRLIWSDAETE